MVHWTTFIIQIVNLLKEDGKKEVIIIYDIWIHNLEIKLWISYYTIHKHRQKKKIDCHDVPGRENGIEFYYRAQISIMELDSISPSLCLLKIGRSCIFYFVLRVNFCWVLFEFWCSYYEKLFSLSIHPFTFVLFRLPFLDMKILVNSKPAVFSNRRKFLFWESFRFRASTFS